MGDSGDTRWRRGLPGGRGRGGGRGNGGAEVRELEARHRRRGLGGMLGLRVWAIICSWMLLMVQAESVRPVRGALVPLRVRGVTESSGSLSGGSAVWRALRRGAFASSAAAAGVAVAGAVASGSVAASEAAGRTERAAGNGMRASAVGIDTSARGVSVRRQVAGDVSACIRMPTAPPGTGGRSVRSSTPKSPARRSSPGGGRDIGVDTLNVRRPDAPKIMPYAWKSLSG